MADSIVGGLFGVDPSALQQQRMTQDLSEGYKLALLDPMQRATAGIYAGAKQFGRAAQGLLGVEDPQLAAAKEAQSIMGQFDPTTSEGLKGLTNALLQRSKETGNPVLGQMAQQASQQYQKTVLNEANVTKALRKPQTTLSDLGKKIAERDELLAGGMKPNDPTILAYNKAIAAAGEGNAPKLSLDLKMLDIAGGRRKTFIDENKPLIEQGSAIGQALTLINADTPFSQAAFENTVVSAFGGDKQKSVKEIQRLINTGSLDQRVENSLRKFATGKIGDVTQEDQRNVLEAVQGDLKRRYEARRNSTIKASSNVKELQGQEDYMAPTWEETVGGGAAQGQKAFTVGETYNSPKFGVLKVLEVDAAGNPTKVQDSKGKIGTPKGTK